MRFSRGGLILLAILSCFCLRSYSQRIYKASSVLATGIWNKVSVSAEGVYKMDVQFLNSLGFGASIPSTQIRVFGKNNGMLPEANDQLYVDDLQEIAIEVVDGGDGVLNSSDYILFYAAGPHKWIKDSVNRKFSHQKNIYSEKQFFYITVGGSGKRIPSQQAYISSPIKVSSFDERYFHELDSVNFLQSGKEWYGEEFSNLPGRTTIKQFTVPSSGIVVNSPVSVAASFASRSINNGSSFIVSVNNQNVLNIPVPAITSGLYESFAREASTSHTIINSQNSLNLSVSYTPGGFNAQGWLNWFEVFYRRQLIQPAGGQLLFRDWNSLGAGAVEYILQADAATKVWEITDPLSPVKMNTKVNGPSIEFGNDAGILREYVSFGNSFLIPQAVSKVPNQDLHNTTETDYIIIAHPLFLPQASQLASFHRQKNDLRTLVVTTEQIFNEFSAGIPDPTSLRDFIKMYYDRYRDTWNDKGKFLLLFGRGSFDYKDRIPGNTNFVLAYQSKSSLDPLGSYTSDDFFGFLDDHENINSTSIINDLDIGIGRIPAKNAEEAKNLVDKIEAYYAPASFGPWRNNINFIADDEDNNLHLQDAEVLANTTSDKAPQLNIYKIYLDAFRQESGLTGGRYPDAVAAINNNIQSGTLIWNYSGHGGPVRLAEETVLDKQIINNWNNANKLPLVITASCDIAPFDQPLYSLGEDLLIRPKNGAIALMTTTRIVFAYSNRIINNNYLDISLQDSAGNYLSLGQAVKETKNYTYRTSGDVTNNRKFTLLGDPAMTLAFPKFQVSPTAINGNDLNTLTDTLSATELVIINGEVRDSTGIKLDDFNGTVYLSLFDKPGQTTTLANDAGSLPVSFSTQTSLLFKGKVSANAGNFQFKFRLPKDINYQYGNGKMSFYAEDGSRDAGGFSSNFIIGGIASGSNDDKEGPEIKAYLNDERFVNGSITNESPILIIKLSDSSGINTGNAGIDHDIIATLDGNNNKYYVLNDFYESELDNYQKGTVRFQLPPLSPGAHSLKIKAWDVMNNSNEYILEFIVANNEELVLDHVLNYPNPFTTKTTFWFEHNKPAIDLKTKIEIFTVTGRIIKTLTKTINTAGNRSSDIEWNGRDEYSMKIGNGVYLYRLTVQSDDGKKATKLQRLVLIR
jgi:hypothetical protein